MIQQKAVNHEAHGEHGEKSMCCVFCSDHPLGDGVKIQNPAHFPVRPVVQMRMTDEIRTEHRTPVGTAKRHGTRA
jgi:hypothetical protein